MSGHERQSESGNGLDGIDASPEAPAPEAEPSRPIEPTGPIRPEPGGLAPDYDEAGQPSFDYVRDRIEGRYATALGEEELAGETPQAESLQEQLAERQKAAKDKLDQIRDSLRGSDDAP